MSTLFEHATTLFLDMNGTFMFGHDRLGKEQDFHPAYLANGGSRLDGSLVNTSVRRVIAQLDHLYQSGSHDMNFPQVFDVAQDLLGTVLEEDDLLSIEKTIASHEMGQVSDIDARALRSLSKRFRLYVVSNLWSRSDIWRDYLTDQLGESTFSGWIFSSDIGVNKPALEIFERALEHAGVDPADVVMIGDDLDRDIRPAVELGMKTVFVSDGITNAYPADCVVPDVQRLV